MCYVNPAAEKITGYGQKEILGMPFWNVIHPEFRDLVKKRGLARQQGKPVPKRYEVKLLHKNGEEHWVDFTATMIEFNRRPAVLGTGIDITERQRAEETLQESEERFRQMAENINEVFWMSNLKHPTMFYVSPAYEQIWGRTCLSLFEEPESFLDAVHPEDRERVITAVKKQHQGEPTTGGIPCGTAGWNHPLDQGSWFSHQGPSRTGIPCHGYCRRHYRAQAGGGSAEGKRGTFSKRF